MKINYQKDPKTIYEESFSTVRRETDFNHLDEKEIAIATRIVHACGMPKISSDLRFSESAVVSGVTALLKGANVICDCNMVKAGISVSDQPLGNDLLCFLNHPKTSEIATSEQTTRSAAQVSLWKDVLADSIVVIGNAPTALFRLIEEIQAGGPKPALVIGFPVGFVGARESKKLLNEFQPLIPHVTLLGRLGGSAMATSALNAIAQLALKQVTDD